MFMHAERPRWESLLLELERDSLARFCGKSLLVDKIDCLKCGSTVSVCVKIHVPPFVVVRLRKCYGFLLHVIKPIECKPLSIDGTCKVDLIYM